jgi:hypothetical protein
MLPTRAIIAAVSTAACLVITSAKADAQTCSIASTTRGPLSCSVTTNVHMSVRIPALVGVTVTSLDSLALASGSVVRAGLAVKTNRSYALQIARAPIDPVIRASASPDAPPVSWATDEHRASLNDTPAQIDAAGGPSDDREPVQVAFARSPAGDVPSADPIRLILTIIAP